MPHRLPPPGRRHEAGLAMVLVAILLIVLLGFVGLAVDTGQVQAAALDLQDAADAAALAGARVVGSESLLGGGTFAATRAAAVGVAAQNRAAGAAVQLDANGGNAAEGDVVVGTWDATTQTFTPTTVQPNAVKVTARRTTGSGAGSLPLTFGKLFGVAASEISRSAVALGTSTPNPLIHVLSTGAASALSVTGTAFIDVPTGRVQVNSANACSIKTNGTANLRASSTTTHGGLCIKDGSIQTAPKAYGDTVADPLAGILPTVADWTAARTALAMPSGANGKIAASGTYSPGHYPKGLSITNSVQVQLNPGTYLIGGAWSQKGQSVVTGSGVTILFDEGVKLAIAGGASLTLTPPASGAYQGLTMMFHRSTTGDKVASVAGTGAIAFAGSLYVPGGQVSLTGTSEVNEFGQIVCDRLACTGTSDVTGLQIVPAASAGSVSLVH